MEATAWGFLAGLVALVWGIFQEYFSAKARERVEQDAFNKADLEFKVLAQKALEKLYARTAEAARGAQTVQDRLDQHMNQGSNNAKPK